jgi:hypothetical protein
LPKLLSAPDCGRFVFSTAQGGQQHSGQDRHDRNGYDQLDQREGATPFHMERWQSHVPGWIHP